MKITFIKPYTIEPAVYYIMSWYYKIYCVFVNWILIFLYAKKSDNDLVNYKIFLSSH